MLFALSPFVVVALAAQVLASVSKPHRVSLNARLPDPQFGGFGGGFSGAGGFQGGGRFPGGNGFQQGGGRGGGGGGRGGGGGGGGGRGGQGQGQAATSTSTTAAAATGNAGGAGAGNGAVNAGNGNGGGNGGGENGANGGGGNGGGGNGGGGNGGDAQSSLTLLANQVQTGLQDNGQNPPVAGQVASLTSSNNFINFCATKNNLPLTNGLQVKTGSCNPTPMGVIVGQNTMPSCKFVFPANLATVPANKDFTIQMAIQNLQTGNFVNAQKYYAAPAQTNGGGTIIGHSHVTIQKMQALTQTTPLDPKTFAFFKGLNDPAQNGQLSATVTGGLPAGAYRMCSINSAANHQPVLVAVAQRGSLDDCVYFTAK